ncbi:hypothetical protein JRQ81_003714 [Phrynocephalus forsythii]|uniref:Uncharacterized protein n=1 Tax=Phrynocephalus forsythii TaxID=171643 RepID=A0A9Q1AX73_9SAUR|nr:hypothetical protein JRQ81_003714 [Phrynocephalus forsythii]
MDIEDFSHVRCHRHVLEKQTHVNQGDAPEQHTFTMTWETHCTDQIFWDCLWGLGLPFSWSFTVEDATPTAKYTEDNEKVVSLDRYIYVKKREVVEVPPRTRAIASLVVFWHHAAAVPFTAIIEKVKSNGDMQVLYESGAWKGLAYRDVHIKVRLEKLGRSCTAM